MIATQTDEKHKDLHRFQPRFAARGRGIATLTALLATAGCSELPVEETETATQAATAAGGWTVEQELGGLRAGMDLDGNWLAARASDANNIRMFQFASGFWNLRQTITPPRGLASGFGDAVCIDGNRLLIGVPSAPARDPGRVLVYRRSGTTWQYIETLAADTSSGAPGHGFGRSIACDSGYAAIAGWDDEVAYLLAPTATGYGQTAVTVPGAVDLGVSASVDGDIAVLSSVETADGRVYSFHHDGTAWSQTDITYFGRTVDLDLPYKVTSNGDLTALYYGNGIADWWFAEDAITGGGAVAIQGDTVWRQFKMRGGANNVGVFDIDDQPGEPAALLPLGNLSSGEPGFGDILDLDGTAGIVYRPSSNTITVYRLGAPPIIGL